ncbi:hypothetical protein [Xanthomonas oryzae]|uniref:hypothetical protein n=1 Tax=Xanthomonas oryzae TaxID=347 RepID=UPI0021DA2C10|nr:hypothetical protein [Xanthomonas oryzae]
MVSRQGGLTLRRHQLQAPGYATYALAAAHAESEQGLYRVLSNGVLVSCPSRQPAAE